MKKYLQFFISLSLILMLNTSVLAVNQSFLPNKPAKHLCFAEEVMKEVLREAAKETVNTVGKHIFNKYIKEKNQKNNNKDASSENLSKEEDTQETGS